MRIPISDPLQKSWEQLDKFRPAVIEEVYRLFNASNSNDILLQRTKENKLAELARRELVEILRKLSKEAFIFRLDDKNFSKRKLIDEKRRNSEFDFLADSDFITVHPDESEPIYLHILPSFNNWYSAYRLSLNTKFSDLSKLNVLKILSMVLDIDEQLQINPSPVVKVDLNTRHSLIDPNDKNSKYIYFYAERENALQFLSKKGAVPSFGYKQPGLIGGDFTVEVNIAVFQKLKEEIVQYHAETFLNKKSSQTTLPPNLSWEDILIHFIDGHNAKITAKNQTFKVNFKDMGFEDRRTLQPNKQWELLQGLVLSQGQISWSDSTANDTIKKKKQNLAKTLKNFFRIDEDPFFPYKNDNTYAIRIRLTSSS